MPVLLTIVLLLFVAALIAVSWYCLRWIYIETRRFRRVKERIAARHYTYLSIFFLGAFAVYVLIVLAFSGFYTLIEQMQPGQHFNGCDSKYRCSWVDMFYFSLITVATVGYGDMWPKSWQMRLVVSSEVLVGIIFIGGILASVLSFGPEYTDALAKKLQTLIDRVKGIRKDGPN